MQQIKIRLSFTGHFMATSLFEVEKFYCNQKRCHQNLVSEEINNYLFLEDNRLKTEVAVFNEREEL